MFDFEEMAELARTQPEAFEKKRQELIDSVINSAPERLHLRLRGIQFRVDMERRRARTPMAACIRAYAMMWESFGRLNVNLQQFTNGERPPGRGQTTAKVLSFPTQAEQQAVG